MAKHIKWSLVHLPDHLGVENVGGRLGAAQGPDAFMRVWRKLRGKRDLTAHLARQERLKPGHGPIEAHHDEAIELIAQAQASSSISLIVGGGHDHGYSQLAGIRKTLGPKKRLGCLNIDAHLDVRKPAPKISSGSPFYLALESKTIDPSRLVEFGIQDHANGPELWDYVKAKRVRVVSFAELRQNRAVARFERELKRLAKTSDALIISLDLDAAAEAFAPGVSAPQAEGFQASELVAMCEIAGRHPKVVSLGLFELNPLHDIADRTARLAATCAYHFLDQALSRGSRRAL